MPKAKNTEMLIILLLLLGVLGAKLMFVLKNPDKADLLFSGTGFSSQGALFGAILASLIYTYFNKVRLGQLLNAAAPAAIMAYAIARMGCFLSGDDCHGIASDLPWAMSFPNGIEPTDIRVHPVPLYEILYSIFIFGILMLYKKTREVKPYRLFFLLMGLWGICRFAVEFVSSNEKLYLSMSGSQIGALIMAIASLIFFTVNRTSNPTIDKAKI